jgi:hypothetical protein
VEIRRSTKKYQVPGSTEICFSPLAKLSKIVILHEIDFCNESGIFYNGGERGEEK